MRKPTRNLTVLKPHKYGTRHLTAGEEYEAPVRHAVALVASKKARFAATSSQKAPLGQAPSSQVPARVEESEPVATSHEAVPEPDELDDLRSQAHDLGIEVDRRWGVVRLYHEIAKARG